MEFIPIRAIIPLLLAFIAGMPHGTATSLKKRVGARHFRKLQKEYLGCMVALATRYAAQHKAGEDDPSSIKLAVFDRTEITGKPPIEQIEAAYRHEHFDPFKAPKGLKALSLREAQAMASNGPMEQGIIDSLYYETPSKNGGGNSEQIPGQASYGRLLEGLRIKYFDLFDQRWKEGRIKRLKAETFLGTGSRPLENLAPHIKARVPMFDKKWIALELQNGSVVSYGQIGELRVMLDDETDLMRIRKLLRADSALVSVNAKHGQSVSNTMRELTAFNDMQKIMTALFKRESQPGEELFEYVNSINIEAGEAMKGKRVRAYIAQPSSYLNLRLLWKVGIAVTGIIDDFQPFSHDWKDTVVTFKVDDTLAKDFSFIKELEESGLEWSLDSRILIVPGLRIKALAVIK